MPVDESGIRPDGVEFLNYTGRSDFRNWCAGRLSEKNHGTLGPDRTSSSTMQARACITHGLRLRSTKRAPYSISTFSRLLRWRSWRFRICARGAEHSSISALSRVRFRCHGCLCIRQARPLWQALRRAPANRVTAGQGKCDGGVSRVREHEFSRTRANAPGPKPPDRVVRGKRFSGFGRGLRGRLIVTGIEKAPPNCGDTRVGVASGVVAPRGVSRSGGSATAGGGLIGSCPKQMDNKLKAARLAFYLTL